MMNKKILYSIITPTLAAVPVVVSSKCSNESKVQELFYTSEKNGIFEVTGINRAYFEKDPKIDNLEIKHKTIEVVEIPEIINEKVVKKIGNEAFKGLSSLKKVIIPSSVSNIGRQAFSDCVNLEEVVFKDNKSNLAIIGYEAFLNCKKLKKIQIIGSNLSNLEILEKAFKNCSSLEGELILPKQTSLIANEAFKDCSSDSFKIKIESESLLSLGNNIFEGTNKNFVVHFTNIKESQINVDNKINTWKNGILPTQIIFDKK